MTTSLILTLGTGPNGAGLGLWSPGQAPSTGEAPAGWAEEAAEALRPLLADPGGLLLADADLDATRREREAGLILAGLVDPAPARALRDRLVGLQARGEALRLCIDARGPAFRDLPWELLAGLPPGRSPLAVAEVVRLQAAEPRALPPPDEQLRVRLWSAQPEDRVAARALAAVEALASASPTILLRRLPVQPEALAPPPGAEGPALLHLVSHGQEGRDGTGVVGEGGLRSAETLARGLARASAGCLLLLGDICGAARVSGDLADSPAWRLAQGGVPVVVAPRTRWALEASRAFNAGLYAALARGETIAAAVEVGRAGLRQLAVAHASCRWWAPMVVVSTPLAVELRLVTPPLRLAGWPPPGPEAGALLRRAVALASGFLGVEHLVAALAEPGGPLAELAPAFAQVLARHPVPPLSGAAALSPRLRALGAELPAGFSARDLGRSLAMVPWVARALDPAARARLLAPAEDDGRGTLPMEPVSLGPLTGPEHALVLEVEGGPEDGRLLVLETPGEVVGRWDPGAPEHRDGRLLADRADADRTLSRRHLVLLGARQVQVAGLTRLQRGSDAPCPVQGALELWTGDLLILGAGTRLRVR